jgi:endonuclease-8
MPEGDTVWLVARRLDEALSGHALTRADLRVPSLATTDLEGRGVLTTVARGKHLLTRIDGGVTLHTHLRMDGMWHLYRPGVRWHGGPEHQIRVLLSTDHWDAVGYRLPVVELVETAHEDAAVGHLGPDLLDPDFDLDEALRRLGTDPVREIGQALLDQRNLAGIGNLYKAEALFLAGISPWTPVGAVDDLSGLVGTARRLLELNKGRAAQITTGDDRTGYDHWVFERTRRRCRRCGSAVRAAMQGQAPYDRITYWCPTCQPGPAPAASSAPPIRGARPRGY